MTLPRSMYCLAPLLMAVLLTACSEPPAPTSGSGTIRVVGAPTGAVVSLDRETVGPLPVTVSNLIADTHLIRVQAPGYRDRYHTVDLDVGEHRTVETTLSPITGLLLVQSSPADAEVRNRNQTIGRTPLALTDLPLGEHEFSFHHAEAIPAVRTVTLTNRDPRRLAVDLTPNTASLQFESDPPGATVLVGGSVQGQTPLTVDRVSTGRTLVKFTLNGHESAERILTLRPGDERRIEVDLTPIPGTLTILSDPPKARVYLDNQFRGLTPVTLRDRESGTYDIRLEMPGYEPQSRTVAFEGTESRTERFSLPQNSGTILVESQPPGVKVFLNGRFRGATAAPREGASPARLEVDLVPAGEHALEFTRRGYEEKQQTVTVQTGRTQRVQVELEKRFLPDTLVRIGEDSTEEIRTGVLVSRDGDGNVELEVRPGVIIEIEAENIVQIKALGPGELLDTTNDTSQP